MTQLKANQRAAFLAISGRSGRRTKGKKRDPAATAPAPKGPTLPAEPPSWPTALPPAFATSPPGATMDTRPRASISGGVRNVPRVAGRYDITLVEEGLTNGPATPTVRSPSSVGDGPQGPTRPGPIPTGAFGPTNGGWPTTGPACSDCGMGLAASSAWRRCPSCAGPLCPGCLIASVREHGKVLCTSCSI
ncbi:MAG: hypothetical protein L3K09_08985 [Thermoplasmata archaeon]|nr:hypothetical protein [Thermoplasmata archaeon]